MAKDKIKINLNEKAEFKNFERTPPATGAIDCIICDTPILIYDYWAVPSVAICNECKKRLKDLLYKESEDE